MKISDIDVRAPLIILLFCASVHSGVAMADVPQCTDLSYDSDGDGWGWENEQTCIVASSPAEVVSSGNATPVCSATAIDPDNDGWGWENNQSCRVSVAGTVEESTPEVLLRESPEPVANNQVPSGAYNWNPDLSEITDLFLITGQSNLRASLTAYDPQLDTIDGRVFAFTEFGYWSVADLHQPWDDGWYPGNGSWFDNSRQPYNNFSFHFAKSLVALDPTRVVGFIVVSAPGKGIAHWDNDGAFWQSIRDKVRVALDAQGYHQQIDAVLWHQGETDWLYSGTADPEVTGAERYEKNYYPRKLRELITNIREEDFIGKGIFICGETVRADMNPHLMALNNDGDARTGCVAGSDLALRPDEIGDPNGVHFSAQALRDLGWRYAKRYLEIEGAL